MKIFKAIIKLSEAIIKFLKNYYVYLVMYIFFLLLISMLCYGATCFCTNLICKQQSYPPEMVRLPQVQIVETSSDNTGDLEFYPRQNNTLKPEQLRVQSANFSSNSTVNQIFSARKNFWYFIQPVRVTKFGADNIDNPDYYVPQNFSTESVAQTQITSDYFTLQNSSTELPDQTRTPRIFQNSISSNDTIPRYSQDNVSGSDTIRLTITSYKAEILNNMIALVALILAFVGFFLPFTIMTVSGFQKDFYRTVLDDEHLKFLANPKNDDLLDKAKRLSKQLLDNSTYLTACYFFVLLFSLSALILSIFLIFESMVDLEYTLTRLNSLLVTYMAAMILLIVVMSILTFGRRYPFLAEVESRLFDEKLKNIQISLKEKLNDK